jgi:hypothetical protein
LGGRLEQWGRPLDTGRDSPVLPRAALDPTLYNNANIPHRTDI